MTDDKRDAPEDGMPAGQAQPAVTGTPAPRTFQGIFTALPAILSFSLVIVIIIFAFIAYRSGVRISWKDEPLIDRINPQEEAAITLSDPQVYSREALINDRRREAEYLERLLKESEREDFLPQVRRAVNTANSISGNINAGISGETSPSSKLSTGKQDSSPGKQEPSANAPTVSDDQLASKSNSKAGGYPQERFRELQAYRHEIRSELAKASLDDLHDYNGQSLFRLQFRATVLPGRYPNKFGAVELKINPPDLDKDRTKLIYLAWLGHATKSMNRISQITDDNPAPRPMRFNDKSPKPNPLIESFYQAPDNSKQLMDNRVELLGQRGEIIEVMEIDRNPYKLKIAVPSRTTEVIRKYLDENFKLQPGDCGVGKQLISTAIKVYGLGPYLAASLSTLNPTLIGQGTEARALLDAEKSLGNLFLSVSENKSKECEYFGREIEKVRSINSDFVPPKFHEKLEELIKKQPPYAYAITPGEVTQRVSNARSAMTTLEMALAVHQSRVGNSSADLMTSTKETLDGLERIPLVVGFSNRVKSSGQIGSPEKTKHVSQAPDTSVSPREASLSQPIDEAVGSPVSDGRSIKKKKDCLDYWEEEGCATFGWIFGPKYRIFSNSKKLEQAVASYDLAADVSFPGWWPIIPMELRTVWVENWDGTSHVLKPTDSTTRTFEVRIPLLTPPDLDSLTGALATESRGPWGQSPSTSVIKKIYPPAVSACSREVTFVIEGDNLWRDAEVYWEGIRGDEITVLPGMRGITAHFAIDKFFGAEKMDKSNKRARGTTLVVQTRGHRVPTEVMFYGDRSGINKLKKETGQPEWECDGPTVSAESEPQIRILPPKIHVVSPATVYACTQKKQITFVIEGVNLADDQNMESLEKARRKQAAAKQREVTIEGQISDSDKAPKIASNKELLKKEKMKISNIENEIVELLNNWNVNQWSPNVFWGGDKPIGKIRFRDVVDTSDLNHPRSVNVIEATFDLPLASNDKGIGMSLNDIRVPISIATKSGIDSQDIIIAACASKSVPASK